MTEEMDKMTPRCVNARENCIMYIFIHTDTFPQIPLLYFIFGMRANEIFVNVVLV